MKKEIKQDQKPAKAAGRYMEGVGRRKTAVARVRVSQGAGSMTVNNKSLKDYFRIPKLIDAAESPLTALKLSDKYNVSAMVLGGGIRAQAEAVRHGLARALVSTDEALRGKLRLFGYLTRDPRMVERKKYGLKKARRAPQWQKR